MRSLKNNHFIFRTNSFQQCPSWHVRAWVTFGRLFAIYQKCIAHLRSAFKCLLFLEVMFIAILGEEQEDDNLI